MSLNRRAFLAASATTGFACFLQTGRAYGALGAQDRFFDWKPVAKDAHAAFGFGGNALVVIGSAGSLLVDCKNAPFGPQLRRESEALGKPLKYVINTHHHGDHTGGNHAFTPDLTVIAQSKATPRILDQKARYISQIKEGMTSLKDKTGPAADQVRTDLAALYARVEKLKVTEFAPKTTFEKDYELDLGAGVKAELHHFGPGHTDNDLVVHIPSLSVLHTGDLLFYRTHPVIDRDGGATTTGWIASLEKAIALCDSKTKVVPGHGELCTVEGLKEQIKYFETMRGLVDKAIKENKPRKDIVELRPAQYTDYARPQGLGMALAAIYDELKAETRP
jgi:glyoxylase-like metal-dependent hydrolase (beta-lactamase superfamily II)